MFDKPPGFYNNESRFFRPTARFGQESAVAPSGNDKSSSSSTPENPSNKRSNQLWAYAAEGTQLAVTLLLGVFVGYKLDARWGTSPWLTLGGAALGLGLGLFNFVRRALTW